MKIEMLDNNQWVNTIWNDFTTIFGLADKNSDIAYFTFDNQDYMVCCYDGKQVFYRIVKKDVSEVQHNVVTLKPFWLNDKWSTFAESRSLKELNNKERFVYVSPGLYFNKNNNMLYKVKDLIEVN